MSFIEDTFSDYIRKLCLKHIFLDKNKMQSNMKTKKIWALTCVLAKIDYKELH